MSVSRSSLALVVAAAIAATAGFAFGNGGKGKVSRFEATHLTSGNGPIEFSALLERVLFRINTVRGKYKVARIKVVNRGKQPVVLSAEKDKLALECAGEPIEAILDLAKHDAETWDSFDPDTRIALAYPETVKAGEEENVFAFIAKPDLAKFPEAIRYTVASLGDPIVMFDRSRAAK